jgi:hypothetical protein
VTAGQPPGVAVAAAAAARQLSNDHRLGGVIMMTVTMTAMVMIRSSARLGAARPPSQPVHHDRTVTVQASGGLSRGGLRVRGRLGADGGLGLGLRAGPRAGPTVAYMCGQSPRDFMPFTVCTPR